MPSTIRLTPLQRQALCHSTAGIRRSHHTVTTGDEQVDHGLYPKRTIESLWARGLIEPAEGFGMMRATAKGAARVRRMHAKARQALDERQDPSSPAPDGGQDGAAGQNAGDTAILNYPGVAVPGTIQPSRA